MRLNRQLTPFMGVVTGLGAREIPDNAAADMRNVRVEDGTIQPRYGYRHICNPVPNFQNQQYMFEYCQGFNQTTKALVEEYLSVEKALGVTRLFTLNPATNVKTEVENITTVVPLDASTWGAFAFNDTAYVYNANNTSAPIYKHLIGDATSMLPFNPAASPATAPTYSIAYGGGSNPYTFINYAGLNMATGVAYVGLSQASGSVNGGDYVGIAHSTNGGVSTSTPTSFEIDLSATTAGARDYSNNDVFLISLLAPVNSPLALLSSGITFTFTNGDGSPVSWQPNVVLQGTGVFSPNYYAVFRIQFDNKNRALWDNIKKIRVNYQLTARSFTSAAANVLQVQTYIGGVMIPQVPDLFNSVFRCTYYSTTTGYESGLSPNLVINNQTLYGQNPLPAFTNLQGLGIHLKLTAPATADGSVNRYRFYETVTNQGNSLYYRLGESATVDLTHKETYAWVLTQATYNPAPFDINKPIGHCLYKGWVIWFAAGGYQNVKHSRIGDPDRLAQLSDEISDLSRGATFTLADDADEPLMGHACGDAVLITGSRGIYAQVGDKPAYMTPPRKLPGSKGAASKYASCRWKDETGNPAVVFLDKRGELWLAQVDQSFSEQGGSRVTEYSSHIRGLLASYLRDGQSLTDFSTCRLCANELDDSLWVVMGKRAVVLRKPSLVDGQRHFELYEYTMPSATIAFVQANNKWGIRALRSSGYTDEFEYNTSTLAFIGGSARDDGSTIASTSSLYWQSKVFSTEAPTRVDNVFIKRANEANTPSVTITSDRTSAGVTTTKTIAANKKHLQFGPTQQGWEHQYKIAIAETDSAIYRVNVEHSAGLSRRITA